MNRALAFYEDMLTFGRRVPRYLTPRDGRPFPPDAGASDLWHWQTKLRTADVDPAAAARGRAPRLRAGRRAP
jgi:hypothetical protein